MSSRKVVGISDLIKDFNMAKWHQFRLFSAPHRAVAPTPAGQAMAGAVFSLHLAGLTYTF